LSGRPSLLDGGGPVFSAEGLEFGPDSPKFLLDTSDVKRIKRDRTDILLFTLRLTVHFTLVITLVKLLKVRSIGRTGSGS
jgi:hypothetical protein